MMKPEQHTNCNQFNQASESVSNVMPSIVARQQRALHASAATSATTNITGAQSKPQPAPRKSFINSNNNNINNNNYVSHKQDISKSTNQHKPQFDQDGLILAKRPAQNPNLVMLSTAVPHTTSHQIDSTSIHNNHGTVLDQGSDPNVRGFGNLMRDLTRELKFNQISGKNVLDQKSELKRVQERMAEARRRKDAEQDRLNRRSSLELRLEERAQKIAKDSSGE